MTRNVPEMDASVIGRMREVSIHKMDAWAPEIIASAPDGVLLVDQQGTILLANKAMAQISGFLESELVGQLIEILMPAELHARHKENVHRFTQNPMRRPMGMSKDLCLQRKDGTSVAVDIALSQCVTQGAAATIVFVRDVSSIRLCCCRHNIDPLRAVVPVPN